MHLKRLFSLPLALLPTLITAQANGPSYAPGTFGVAASDSPFISINSLGFYLRPSDGLFMVQGPVPITATYGATGNPYGIRPGPCSPYDACTVQFQSDGNLVEYYNGAAVWQSGTSGTGALLQFTNGPVYAYVLDAAGNILWESNPPELNEPHPCTGNDPQGFCAPP